MKKLFNALAWMFALNFLGVVGMVGWLYSGGRLDREHVTALKQVLFPSTAPATQPTTAPAVAAVPLGSKKLEQLLASKTHLQTSEQMTYLQGAFDSQKAELDRKERDAKDLIDQARREQETISRERTALAEAQKKLDADRQEQTKLDHDKGFQESLQRYQAMSTKQVKEIFMKLDDDIAERYLEAMPERTAARIMKEFKSPEELARVQKIMEKMRLQASARDH